MAAAERNETLNVPLKILFETIGDYGSYPKFVTGMKTTEVVKSEGNKSTVRFDLEIMKRVQYTLSIVAEMGADGKSAEVKWTLESSDFLKANNGGWKLRAIDERKTDVTYWLDIDFDFPVPGFIVKNMVKTSLPTAIREFGDEATRRSRTN